MQEKCKRVQNVLTFRELKINVNVNNKPLMM